eukprot:1143459-Pelagomonas_calceolata.AAC.2
MKNGCVIQLIASHLPLNKPDRDLTVPKKPGFKSAPFVTQATVWPRLNFVSLHLLAPTRGCPRGTRRCSGCEAVSHPALACTPFPPPARSP